MIQFLVNHFLTFFKRIITLSATLLIAACSITTTDIQPLVPFRYAANVTSVAPHDKPALWVDNNVNLMAWPGEPASPGIRLLRVDPANAGLNSAKVMPLGRVPYQVNLFAAEETTYHLLWLDKTLPGETQLAGSLVSADGQVLRDPAVISKRPTAQYQAAVNTEGDLLILWVASDNDHSLFIQLVDRKGRIQQAARLAKNASYPSAAFDMNGDLHLIWLETAPSRSWTIHYAVLPKGDLPYDDTTTNTLIGVLPLDEAHILDSFTMGIDASHIYCLWMTKSIEQKTGLPESQPAGLMFPVRDNTAVEHLSFDKFTGINIRHPVVPARTLPSLTIGVVASFWQGGKWHDVPAAMLLTPEGTGELHPVYDPQSSIGSIDKVALAVDGNGSLFIGWSDLQTSGTANLYFATTR